MGKIVQAHLMPHPPIMIPEVGLGQEGKMQKTIDACKEVAKSIKENQPDTIVIISPHGPVFSDAIAVSYGTYIEGNLKKFGVEKVSLEFNNDKRLVDQIYNEAFVDKIMMAKIDKESAELYGVEYELDHGALVPLYYISKEYNDFNLVHITYGMLSKMQLYGLGVAIDRAIKKSGKKAIIIGSGDLSHKLKDAGPYDYSPYGKEYDEKIMKYLSEGKFIDIFNMNQEVITEAGECGMKSIYILCGTMNYYKVYPKKLSYEGPFGVGYGVISFNLEESTEDRYESIVKSIEDNFVKKYESSNVHVRLARDSLTNFLTTGKYLKIPEYVTNDMLKEEKGVFVSLKVDGQLRGCIGTFMSTTENIATEIIKNAVEAGEQDPRFTPVSLHELRDIDFSVDILSEPEKASIEELDSKKYGVIVKCGNKSGLLLPNLEGVNTVEEQLEIALRKAGINSNESYEIERFEVKRYKE